MDDKLHAMVGGFSQRPRPDDFDDEFDEMETASDMEDFSPVEEKYAVDGADPSSDAFSEDSDESTYDEGGEGSEGEIERLLQKIIFLLVRYRRKRSPLLLVRARTRRLCL